MRRLLYLISLLSCTVLNAKTLRFVSQWPAQSLNVGYYIALEKGFYDEEGLNVEIIPHGVYSNRRNMDILMAGEADIAGVQFCDGMIQRGNGNRIYNVLQLTRNTGLCCVAQTPVSSPKDLDGMTIARDKAGYDELCSFIENYNSIKVNWLSYVNTCINLYISGAVDAALCFSFSELPRLMLAKGNIPEENIMRFSELGFNIPEDGLYVTGEYYEKNTEAVDKFVKATVRGWKYAKDNMDEAVEISLKKAREANIMTNKVLERMMLEEYLRLQTAAGEDAPSYEKLKNEDIDRISAFLLDCGMIGAKIEYEDIIR